MMPIRSEALDEHTAAQVAGVIATQLFGIDRYKDQQHIVRAMPTFAKGLARQFKDELHYFYQFPDGYRFDWNPGERMFVFHGDDHLMEMWNDPLNFATQFLSAECALKWFRFAAIEHDSYPYNRNPYRMLSRMSHFMQTVEERFVPSPETTEVLVEGYRLVNTFALEATELWRKEGLAAVDKAAEIAAAANHLQSMYWKLT